MLGRFFEILGLSKKPPVKDGLVYLERGATVPADGTAGYGVGCIFQHTDGGDGTALYVNEGTGTSADFNAITVA